MHHPPKNPPPPCRPSSTRAKDDQFGLLYSANQKMCRELHDEIRRDGSLDELVEDRLRCDYVPSAVNWSSGCQAPRVSRVPRGDNFVWISKNKDRNSGPHIPDKQVSQSKAYCPGIVIEVSCKQKRKDLRKLANEYTIGSDSDIQVALGLGNEYNTIKQATLSFWRSTMVMNQAGQNESVAQALVENQDNNGNPSVADAEGLQLCLGDFATGPQAGPESKF
ncbi:hypothetical protein JHW43_000741 [Diplocarpon mali]|nr:hypothetical protein JHW43_000741 [Diplocarpon mali]